MPTDNNLITVAGRSVLQLDAAPATYVFPLRLVLAGALGPEPRQAQGVVRCVLGISGDTDWF